MAAPAARLLFQGSAVASRKVGGKLYDRLKVISDDYKFVFLQMATDARAKPIGTCAKILSIISFSALCYTNVDMRVIEGSAIDARNALALLSAPERNPTASAHVSRLTDALGCKRVHRTNFFVFSLFFEESYNKEVRKEHVCF